MDKKEESKASIKLGVLGIIFAVLFAPVRLILDIVGLVIDKPESKRKKAIKLNVIAIIFCCITVIASNNYYYNNIFITFSFRYLITV